jgi:hypothetical protein
VRTTVTLDPDVEALVRKLMRERGLTFKQAINSAIRSGLAPKAGRSAFRTKTAALGPPRVPLEHALRLAAEIEDDEIARKLALRK